MSLCRNPLLRVVFAQRVFFFTPHCAKRLVELATVTSCFRDTIENYGEAIFDCWRRNSKGNDFGHQFVVVCGERIGASLRFVAQFLAAGALPTMTGTFRTRDHLETRGQPIHAAASYGHADIVAELIEAGAEVNAGANEDDRNTCTALYCAVFYNQLETVRILVAAGADLEKTHPAGYTPLDIAAKCAAECCRNEVLKKKIDIIQVLVAAGANVNVRNEHSWKYAHFPELLKALGLGVNASAAGRRERPSDD